MSAPDNYRGLCASTYDILAPHDAVGDADFFRQIIADGGQPALEVACGTGRLLLPYVREGLDVDGMDLSAEMLEICREKARGQGVDVTLYEQPMQGLDVPRRYRTIYIPFYSFQLLVDDDDVAESLRRFHQHLEPGGRLVVPLFFPFDDDVATEPAPAGEWRVRRESRREDGATVRAWENATYDFESQVKQSTLRFEVVDSNGETAASEDVRLGIRWHTQPQFDSMLRAAGFGDIDVFKAQSSEPASADDTMFTFVAEHPSPKDQDRGAKFLSIIAGLAFMALLAAWT